MIKNDLIDAVRREIGGVSSREVWTYITFILDEIAASLERGESVKITNFGVFEIRNKKERIGRNPKTLEEAVISARKVVRFRMSKNVFDILNADEFDMIPSKVTDFPDEITDFPDEITDFPDEITDFPDDETEDN